MEKFVGGERILWQLPPFQKEAFECQFIEFIIENGSVHSGPDPLETIFVKIEKSLKNIQNASKNCNKLEFCA